MSHSFGTVIPHPLALISGANDPFETGRACTAQVLPLANLMFMVVMARDFDEVTDAEFDEVSRSISARFARIEKEEFFIAARLGAAWTAYRCDPVHLQDET